MSTSKNLPSDEEDDYMNMDLTQFESKEPKSKINRFEDEDLEEDFLAKNLHKLESKVVKRDASSDEEDDYLDMDLDQLEKEFNKPSALSYSQKRAKTLLDQKKKGYNVPLKDREKNQLHKALNTPINKTNKGFNLLSKMGYKPGEGLGVKKEGIQEPIKINLSTGNKGLGFADQEKEKVEVKQTQRKQLEKISQTEFLANSRTKFQFSQMKSDLYKSRVVCEQLDRKVNIIDNPLWTPFSKHTQTEKEKEKKLSKANGNEEDSDSEEEPNLEKTTEDLEMITNYLRTKYFYCLWCGDGFETKEDLLENCPGNTREDH